MKITISVGGKFHAFHLALALQKKGYLDRIFTSYPWFKVKESGLHKERVTCLMWKEALELCSARMPFLKTTTTGCLLVDLFDHQVAKRVGPCDIFVGWSGFSLFTIKKIRVSFPAKIILERGSSHIESQRDNYLQEQQISGIKLALPDESMINKELEEYQKADYISVPSKLARQTFIAKGFPDKKMIQVPLGVDVEAFRPAAKNDRTFRVIAVGIAMQKGVHYILRAMDELKLKNAEVWLIGRVNEDMKPAIRSYGGRLHCLGSIFYKRLYQYYSQGSISILFSLDDGFGMSLLEAMACSLPVICSTQTGAKDVVREGTDGFIVTTRDVQALKDKISYLYDNPQAAKAMGDSARENMVNNFTWGNYGERIISNYLGLLK